MTRRSFVAPLVLALAVVGCATTPTSSLDSFAQRSASNSFELLNGSIEPPNTLMLPVAHDRQLEGPSCGAHVLASVINYWRGAGAVSGSAIYSQTPPHDPSGYSVAELLTMARANGLIASAVRLGLPEITGELEAGRPVLVPVRVPSVYLQGWTLPGANEPVIGFPARLVTSRVGRFSEWTNTAMVNHYLLVVGYEGDTVVVLEPLRGFRTMSLERLERYRRAFGDAAIVFSASSPPVAQSAATVNPATGQP